MADTHDLPQRRDLAGEARTFPFPINALRYIIDIMRSLRSPHRQPRYVSRWSQCCAIVVCNIALLQPPSAIAIEPTDVITATTTTDGKLGSVIVRIQRAIANGEATTLQSLATPPPARYAPTARQTNTAYVTTNRDATGLIRVVDNGAYTLLEFVDLDLAHPVVATDADPSLPVRRNGNYLVVDGVHRNLIVYAYGNVSRVKAIGPAPTPLPHDPWAQGTPYGNATDSPTTAEPEPAAAAVATNAPPGAAHTPPGAPFIGQGAPPQAPTPPAPPALASAAPAIAAAEPPSLIAPERLAIALVPPATPVVPPTPTIDITPLRVPAAPAYSAAAGTSVRAVITAWSAQADWQLRWLAPIDYPLPVAVTYEGDFLTAVRHLLAMYAKQGRPLVSDAYTQQSLVVVKEIR